jgi:hypothetical protein
MFETFSDERRNRDEEATGLFQSTLSTRHTSPGPRRDLDKPPKALIKSD